MRAYIQKIDITGELINMSLAISKEGFTQMGFHIIEVPAVLDIPLDDSDFVVVGAISFIHSALQHLGKAIPEEINYPECLTKYLGRSIWTSTINEISNNPDQWNVFVKPKYSSKKFTGKFIRTVGDLRSMGDQFENTEVFVSEGVNFLREWRCFVRYGQIIDVRPYKGDWRINYNPAIIEQALKDYTNQPAAFTMDFGVTDKGETLLVEVNDGYSLGAYGLFYLDYVKLISARWAEMTGTEDLCKF